MLPKRLVADYGHRGPYTPSQVEHTVKRYKLPAGEHLPYALSIFCDEAKLKEHWNELRFDRNRLRGEVADTFFDGNPDFALSDVFRYSRESAGAVGSHEHANGGSHDGHGHSDGGGGHH